ncbi:retrovirus-related pol polyprotein from transposon TNT 1-94 [Tanacetum coccineum]
MSSLAEFMILSGGDNRPPMFEKHLYDFWKRKMELYMQNRERGRMILESSCQGSIGKSSTTNARYLIDKAGKGVNTKFLNSLPPEWSKFVTHVKLVRDLHTTNFDQLHAYLEQHELHANEVRRQSSFVASTSGTRANISGTSGNNSGQQRAVKCFNCKGEGHMAIQYPKPKRKRDATWFRDKVLLVEAQGSSKILNEEELEFLADPGVVEAKAVLMANLFSYELDVLSEVLHVENTHNDMINQSVQEMPYSEQTYRVNYPENEITSDCNIIPYSQYLLATQNAVV